MIVQLRKFIGGYRNGLEWPPAGAFVELPEHEALDMVEAGYAVEADAGDAHVYWTEGDLHDLEAAAEHGSVAGTYSDGRPRGGRAVPPEPHGDVESQSGEILDLKGLNKATLIEIAESRGVTIRKTWSVGRIVEAIAGGVTAPVGDSDSQVAEDVPVGSVGLAAAQAGEPAVNSDVDATIAAEGEPVSVEDAPAKRRK